jgi:hypothetical protein
VSLEHTLFLDFFLDISLAEKKNVFFEPMNQKLWMIEVSRRSLGKAGMCWSQPARVDHLCKKWRAGRNFFLRKMEIAP